MPRVTVDYNPPLSMLFCDRRRSLDCRRQLSACLACLLFAHSFLLLFARACVTTSVFFFLLPLFLLTSRLLSLESCHLMTSTSTRDHSQLGVRVNLPTLL